MISQAKILDDDWVGGGWVGVGELDKKLKNWWACGDLLNFYLEMCREKG